MWSTAIRFVRRFRFVLVTAVAVMGLAVTALGTSSAVAASRSEGSPNGSWLLTVSGPGIPTTTIVAALGAGGVVTSIDLNPPSPYTAVGTWARTGAHAFTDTFYQVAVIPELGQVVFHVTGNGKVNGDSVSGTFTFEVLTPSDLTPIPTVTGNGKFTGSRVEL